jgi:hypothetical protein
MKLIKKKRLRKLFLIFKLNYILEENFKYYIIKIIET